MKTSELIELRVVRLRAVCRTMKLSLNTERSYEGWVRRFIEFCARMEDWKQRTREEMLRLFLEAGAENWSASTQNQALNAIVFYYWHVLERPLGKIGEWAAAKRPARLPVWLPHEDMMALIGHLRGLPRLMAEVDYGSGARSHELVSVRVKDVDLGAMTLTVRGGKGAKDRVTILPQMVIPGLTAQLREMRNLWQQDRARGRPGVAVPSEKFNGCDWEWFWIWAARNESADPRSGVMRRHHVHDTTLGKALAVAVKRWGGNQRVTVHSLRHSFATSLLMAGTPIQDVQALLGHANIATTQIYAHCLPRLTLRVKSPMDAPASNVVQMPRAFAFEDRQNPAANA